MAHATAQDYVQYGNGSIQPDKLQQALEAASDEIDTLTYSRIVAKGLNNLTPFQRLRVVKAVCQQADFTYQYGDYISSPLASYSAGSISMSFKTEEGAGGVQKSPSVLNLLRSTGLTNRGLC